MGKDLPWLVGVALAVSVALSVAAYALGSGTTSVSMLAIALIALGVAHLIQLMRNYLQSADVARLVTSQRNSQAITHGIVNEANRISLEHATLAQTVEQVRRDSAGLSETLSASLTGLRESQEQVAQSLQTFLDAQRSMQPTIKVPAEPSKNQTLLDAAIAREQEWMSQITDPQPSLAPEPEQSFESTELGNALSLAMEPIVDLYTSNTAHYRMVLGMTNPQGQDVPQDVFFHHADRLQLRDQLDIHVVEQTLALLAQLRQRDPKLAVFVPIGATTLANPVAINSILALLATHSTLASGIVLDISHAVLASLSDSSLEGLATLARAGVVLSLSQASIAGVELSSLNRLNVRYIGIAASSVGVGAQLSPGLPGFVQSARAMRIQVIISQVGDPRHVQGLSRTARFASGPAFAPPRKLKRNAPERQTFTAAA